MSKKFFAVENFSIEISDPLVSCSISRTGSPSTKNKSSGKFICLDGFGISVSNITKPPATIPDPGPYTVNFSATSTKNKEKGGPFFLRVDDQTGDIHAIPQQPGSPPTPSPVTFHLKISDANQTKDRGE